MSLEADTGDKKVKLGPLPLPQEILKNMRRTVSHVEEWKMVRKCLGAQKQNVNTELHVITRVKVHTLCTWPIAKCVRLIILAKVLGP